MVGVVRGALSIASQDHIPGKVVKTGGERRRG